MATTVKKENPAGKKTDFFPGKNLHFFLACICSYLCPLHLRSLLTLYSHIRGLYSQGALVGYCILYCLTLRTGVEYHSFRVGAQKPHRYRLTQWRYLNLGPKLLSQLESYFVFVSRCSLRSVPIILYLVLTKFRIRTMLVGSMRRKLPLNRKSIGGFQININVLSDIVFANVMINNIVVCTSCNRNMCNVVIGHTVLDSRINFRAGICLTTPIASKDNFCFNHY